MKDIFRHNQGAEYSMGDPTIKLVEQFVSNKTIVGNILTKGDLETRIAARSPITLMMGQTFDDGQPVDMMKYALFMMTMSDILRQGNIEVTPTWLIADHFITDINQDREVEDARRQGSNRVAYLDKLNQVYGGDIGFIFSSDLSNSDKYQENLARLMSEAETNKEFRAKVLEAVPEDRRSNLNAYKYPFEELATIQTVNTDIKIGPPYEQYYDIPARVIAPVVGFNKFIGIHLTKGFPFGNPTDIPESTQHEIEANGVLPYKLGSKGLGAFRIDAMSDKPETVGWLIRSTTDMRAIVDLIVTAEHAKRRLSGNIVNSPSLDTLYGYSLVDFTNQIDVNNDSGIADKLRELSFQLYMDNIYSPLHKG